MSRTDDTRLRPIAALRAIRALMRDREDTRQAFLLMDALRGKTTLRQIARFRGTDVGRAVLAERRRLLDRLADRASLAGLPAATLGRAYYDFMESENLSAEGLAAVSNLNELPPGDDMTLFRERTREMHDLLHIVSGYGRDPLGEACVGAFTFAQTGLKGFGVTCRAGGRAASGGRRLDQRSQPHQAHSASPMTSRLSSSLSHGNSSVNIVTHCRQEHGILLMSVPQNIRCGPNASKIRRR